MLAPFVCYINIATRVIHAPPVCLAFQITLAGGAKINGVPITKTDIKTTNGIIHAVKGVLIPK